MSQPSISVIIVNWNTRSELERCLRTLLSPALPSDWEVLVSDNASTDGSAEMVARNFPGVKLVPNKANLGYAAGVNRGVDEARGQSLCILNADTVVEQRVLRTLHGFLLEHSEAGLAAPLLGKTSGGLHQSIGRVPGFRDALAKTTILRRLVPRSPRPPRIISLGAEPFRVPPGCYVRGAAWMVPRRVFQELGGLDERFFLFYEDVDFCVRLARAGYQAFLLPSLSVLHLHGRSRAQIGNEGTLHHLRSLARFLEKHYGATRTALFKACWKPLYLASLQWSIARDVLRVDRWASRNGSPVGRESLRRLQEKLDLVTRRLPEIARL